LGLHVQFLLCCAKVAAWKALCEEFNGQTTSGVCRDISQLKHVCIWTFRGIT